ncbi:site-specific integrase [Vibrio parahaemolyticus]|nr:site-specific integrase [Vibrio parahaemolyticus]
MAVNYIKNQVLWDSYNPLEDELNTFPAIKRYPFISYPNGKPCYEANLYIRKLVQEGRSTFGKKGGTLHTYASQIIQLIHYIYKKRIELTELTNSSFGMFIRNLSKERQADNITPRRSANTVISIGMRCLDFLHLVQDVNHLKFFIGTEPENSITVSVVKSSRKIEGYSGLIIKNSMRHSSFPDPSATNKKTPISEEVHDKLFNYIISNKNIQVKERNLAIFHCLDQCGARRAEIINIQVSDINAAIRSKDQYPLLRLINLKQQDSERKQRYVPVSRVFLSEMSNYIRHFRRPLIKKKIGKTISYDHGFLFVSTSTGRQLSEDTLTTYFTVWRENLKIEEELHAHLFRNTYITNKLIEIIESRSDIKTPEDLRRLLLNTERFKQELKEWTGHKFLSSLEVYINLAFARHFKFDSEVKALQVRTAIDSTRKAIKRIRSNLINGVTSNYQTIDDIQRILSSLESDIS